MQFKNEELFLLYQPQVDSESNDIIGAEALIRWNHPELGIISHTSLFRLQKKHYKSFQ